VKPIGFVLFASTDSLELHDALAQRYGGRPSRFADLSDDPQLAIWYDEAAMIAGQAAELRARRRYDEEHAAAQDDPPRSSAGPGAMYDAKSHTLRGSIPVAPRPAGPSVNK
jgi:hypothetical protein